MNIERAKLIGLILLAVALPISHVPVQFAVAFLFFAAMYEHFVLKSIVLKSHLVMKLLLAYVAWNAFCALLSPRPLHSLWATVDNEWPSLTMVTMVWLIDDPQTLRRLMRMFLFSAGFVAAYAIVSSLIGYDVIKGRALDPIGSHFYRATGLYGFYLTYAAHAMNVFFLAWFYLLEEKKDTRPLIVVVLVVGVAIVLTFARSIWIGMAILIPVGAIVKWGRSSWKVLLPAILAAAALLIAAPTIRDRALSVLDFSQNETRLNLWKTALSISSDHRVVGIGEDNWDYYFDRYKVQGFYDTTVHAHTDYLTVLVNAGIPGFILFCWMWFVVLRIGFRTWKNSGDTLLRAASAGGSLAIAGMLIGSLFQNYYGTFVNCFGWWFLAGIVLTAEKLAKSVSTQTSL